MRFAKNKIVDGYLMSCSILKNRTKSNEIRYLLVNATTRRDADRNIIGGMWQFME
jgi:hypothetical protein